MNPNDVIEAYVVDVTRRMSSRERNEIGLELRGLLGEMLADRAASEGRPADDAMVLAMLREFGTPSEIAARYSPPREVIIPAEQTRAFTLTALIGVALQWALTLPPVFEGQPFASWWLTNGLGALWWPGFMLMMSLVAMGLRRLRRPSTPAWNPRIVDPDRIHRGAMAAALLAAGFGSLLMISLPWITPHLPGALPRVLAFDETFLRERAWPVLILWAGSFATLLVVFIHGRWTNTLRRLETIGSIAFIVLQLWWMASGPMFQSTATDNGARVGLGLVIAMLVLDLIVKQVRRRPALGMPKLN